MRANAYMGEVIKNGKSIEKNYQNPPIKRLARGPSHLHLKATKNCKMPGPSFAGTLGRL